MVFFPVSFMGEEKFVILTAKVNKIAFNLVYIF
jgi:hypothetical protein